MITKYQRRFSKLRPDLNRKRWPAATYYQAPHKPLLLLAVMDLFARGQIESNLIEITPDLGELFTSYWMRVMQPDQRSTIALPFFHLWKEKESFWHLAPRPGKEELLAEAYRVPATAHKIRFSVNKLNEAVLGASLDEDLYALMCLQDARNALRDVIIKTYFTPDLQTMLVEQGLVNVSVFSYSQVLLTQARKRQIKRKDVGGLEVYPAVVRAQGFRRAVVTAYDHRCALCGIRILTLEGHTVVAASHIIPWAISHNDDPRNGMALCRVCHWCFDEGLISVTSRYVLVLSTQLTVNRNIASYILTLSDRSIIGPAEEQLWPDLEALTWHNQHVFRKR
jgi:putative restriction endonuclease